MSSLSDRSTGFCRSIAESVVGGMFLALLVGLPRPWRFDKDRYMDLGSLPVFKMMTAKMNWLETRQRVLSQNIANADTPGYRPKDLEEIDFKSNFRRSEFRLQLAVTNQNHVQSKIQQSSFGDEKESRKSYEVSPTGNAVVLEEQLIKVADSAGAHQLATSLYRKNINLFRIALGRQGGQ